MQEWAWRISGLRAKTLLIIVANFFYEYSDGD